MRQEEVFIAPCFELCVVGNRVSRASAVHGRVKSQRVGIALDAALVENGRQIGTAAEPPFAGHDHARIHMNGGHVGIARMGYH